MIILFILIAIGLCLMILPHILKDGWWYHNEDECSIAGFILLLLCTSTALVTPIWSLCDASYRVQAYQERELFIETCHEYVEDAAIAVPTTPNTDFMIDSQNLGTSSSAIDLLETCLKAEGDQALIRAYLKTLSTMPLNWPYRIWYKRMLEEIGE